MASLRSVRNQLRLKKLATLRFQVTSRQGRDLTPPGGAVKIEGGTGYSGASGGDVNIGPGTYKAGDAGSSGAGGVLVIKGGDAK